MELPEDSKRIRTMNKFTVIAQGIVPRGQGKNNGPLKAGPGGVCKCPKCGNEMPHAAGVPCSDIRCDKCGTMMVRKDA